MKQLLDMGFEKLPTEDGVHMFVLEPAKSKSLSKVTVTVNKPTKEKAIVQYVLRWLNSNIDDQPPEGIQEDSANLKEKILLALDPGTTIEDIESGNF